MLPLPRLRLEESDFLVLAAAAQQGDQVLEGSRVGGGMDLAKMEEVGESEVQASRVLVLTSWVCVDVVSA